MIETPKAGQIPPQIQYQQPDGSVSAVETPNSTHKLLAWDTQGKDYILCTVANGVLRQFPQKGIEGANPATRIARNLDGTFRSVYAYFAE